MPSWSCGSLFGCSAHRLLCGLCVASVAVRPVHGEPCGFELETGIAWEDVRSAAWNTVEERSLPDLARFSQVAAAHASGLRTRCVLGMLTVDVVLAAEADLGPSPVPHPGLAVPWADAVLSGFPLFGALQWLAVGSQGPEGCGDVRSRAFRELLAHHGGAAPPSEALEFLSDSSCPLGRVAAVLSLARAQVGVAVVGEAGAIDEVLRLVRLAERLLPTNDLGALAWDWPVLGLLHKISHALAISSGPAKAPGGCIILIHAFPTVDIRNETGEALRLLEENYFSHLGVRYPLIVFTDDVTAKSLKDDFAPFTSAPVVPAVIPLEELSRHMPSFSCVDGLNCESGAEFGTGAHRGVVNKTQFWSPEYMRISRYSAGPLFQHASLDQCGAFLKMDTDFYITRPLDHDPIQAMQQEGARLAFWQLQVQGQRQEGYMDAAVSFLRDRGLKVRNSVFYARGLFEDRAQGLGIPIEEVPEALQAATVIYGCLFGGDVRFFREPLYQDFFRYMDARQGFETAGWSNQFFLGTAAAAFLWQSEIMRLHVSGRHQESKIDCVDGNVTEYLTGSSSSIMR